MSQIIGVSLYIINTSDFDFMFSISRHPRFTPSIACQMLDIAAETCLKQLVYVRSALKLALSILARFETDKKVVARVIGIAKANVVRMQKMDKVKVALYNKVKRAETNQIEIASKDGIITGKQTL